MEDASRQTSRSTKLRASESRTNNNFDDYKISKIIQTARKSVDENPNQISQRETLKNKRNNSVAICKDPSELLTGISELFVNTDLGVNFTKKGAVTWRVLSNSILNKFAPGHTVFKQQLEIMKSKEQNSQNKKKDFDILLKRTIKRQSQKNLETEHHLTGFQKLRDNRIKNLEKKYAGDPRMKELTRVKDDLYMSNLQLDMMINTVKIDNKGKILNKNVLKPKNLNTKRSMKHFKSIESKVSKVFHKKKPNNQRKPLESKLPRMKVGSKTHENIGKRLSKSLNKYGAKPKKVHKVNANKNKRNNENNNMITTKSNLDLKQVRAGVQTPKEGSEQSTTRDANLKIQTSVD
ncbi:unnamed protein product [Moneuplotes crassus]|uniref:Uncharacterized protein n=1 Tax=Euplotes crassus TaxID=5936 RepID=A0AAD1XBE8_EUPCR|nr:unnamed protein product [Moneuplotes crassus]